FEQILVLERTYHENLKQNIIKYSRPLRRYLNPNEIVDLFQNIEKISAISQSIVRHCEKLFDEDNTFHVPISIIYQSCLDVMTDSYNTYISRSIQVQAIIKQYCHKIAYFLQKFLKKTTIKSNDSLSSSVSYATISSISIRKCDSGFSETASSIQTTTCFEQILVLERTYHENLKQNIIKYSRPLRRYLNPNEIVDLFQKIEKISAISQSIVRHCEKLFD
ncbi:unnamed protein product, partial [Rotaria sp. Silwood2]